MLLKMPFGDANFGSLGALHCGVVSVESTIALEWADRRRLPPTASSFHLWSALGP
jgi:hypothetical protein